MTKTSGVTSPTDFLTAKSAYKSEHRAKISISKRWNANPSKSPSKKAIVAKFGKIVDGISDDKLTKKQVASKVAGYLAGKHIDFNFIKDDDSGTVSIGAEAKLEFDE